MSDLETSTTRRSRPDLGYYATGGREKSGAECTSTSYDNPHQVDSSSYFLSLGCQYSRQHSCSQTLSTFVPICERSSSTPIQPPSPTPQKVEFHFILYEFRWETGRHKRLLTEWWRPTPELNVLFPLVRHKSTHQLIRSTIPSNCHSQQKRQVTTTIVHKLTFMLSFEISYTA